MMCQAPGASIRPPYRVYAQIWAVATPWRHEQREALLAREPPVIAPKVHFLNTALEKECPLRPSVRSRPIRSPSAPCTG